jgi:hypothetical protein
MDSLLSCGTMLGVVLHLEWLRLIFFSFVKNKNITLYVAFTMNDFTDMLHLPISVEAMAEFHHLQALDTEVQLAEEHDR